MKPCAGRMNVKTNRKKSEQAANCKLQFMGKGNYVYKTKKTKR